MSSAVLVQMNGFGFSFHALSHARMSASNAWTERWSERCSRSVVTYPKSRSSWINQVERWFGYLTDQKIRRGVHKSVQALEADIRDWIDHWNENPRPFAWTKTAEEILNSLAEYLSKISSGTH